MLRGEISAAPLLAMGLLPALGGGASFGTRFRWTSMSLGLEARMLTSMADTFADGVLVHASLAMPALDVCGHRASLSLCAVFSAGELRITSDPGVSVQSHRPWISAVGMRVSGDWLFSEHLSLRGFAELHAHYSRPSVWVNHREVWQLPPLTGVVGVGLVLPVGCL
ncbi:hypothetical protein SOCEGT47_022230 [Sorangium cellulosum]|uniref:Uncharacterized protein n=2 Tax=Sorangium cellulosum TaxID=56 RepID=A0A4P2PYR9_SORCE|nr:hypothetical protein SOCEGT47_022230 [Sorangium cellulosum]